MNPTIAFDTHQLIKSLLAVGFDEKQAEAITEAFRKSRESSMDELATKQDVADLRRDLKELELRMTIKLGAMLAVAVAVVAALVKLL